MMHTSGLRQTYGLDQRLPPPIIQVAVIDRRADISRKDELDCRVVRIPQPEPSSVLVGPV